MQSFFIIEISTEIIIYTDTDILTVYKTLTDANTDIR